PEAARVATRLGVLPRASRPAWRGRLARAARRNREQFRLLPHPARPRTDGRNRQPGATASRDALPLWPFGVRIAPASVAMNRSQPRPIAVSEGPGELSTNPTSAGRALTELGRNETRDAAAKRR